MQSFIFCEILCKTFSIKFFARISAHRLFRLSASKTLWHKIMQSIELILSFAQRRFDQSLIGGGEKEAIMKHLHRK